MTINKHPDMMDPPIGKSVVGTSTKPLNELEKNVISTLDEDKVSDLAECLFTLNNRHYGPIAGAYVAVCTIEGKEWCVGQLNADRAKPLILFDNSLSSASISFFPKAVNLCSLSSSIALACSSVR